MSDQREKTILDIDVDHELENIISQLGLFPDKVAAPKILKNAINSTARKVRKQMVAETKDRYAVSNNKIWKDKKAGAPQIETASPENLTATIRARGNMQDIMIFTTRPNTATTAAAAKVLQSSQMKDLEVDGLKAFISRFASGHVAIVQRVGPERLPVKKLLSPSIPHMMGNQEVWRKSWGVSWTILYEEIQKRIDKIRLK